MSNISVLIPTFNCSDSIETTLKSVDWADEIVIVDSYSTDDTLQIVGKYTSNIYQRVYDTPSQQKNWALQYCQYDWVLQLDADEALEVGAEIIIRTALREIDKRTTLFVMPRKNHVLRRWIRYGGLYPDGQTRLFHKNKARFDERIVHEKVVTEGETKQLSCHILHYGMPHLSKQIKNLDRYTRYEADELKKKGQQFSYLKWLVYPWLVFGYKYFWLQGFRDGWRGFFLAVYVAFYYFVVQTKLRELEILELDKSP